MKTLLASAAAALAILAPVPQASAGGLGKPDLLGEIVLPTGLKLGGIEFGGISGLDYDAANELFYAISDDRSEKAPARFYVLKLAIDDKGVHGLDVVSSTPLLDAAGKPFATKDVDPEAIRFNAATGTFYWSSEGDLGGKPAVRESRTDGTLVREFSLPEAYLPNADKTRGVRNNLAFEAITISADGKTLLVGTENALVQDGDKATLQAGSRARILTFNIASGEVAAEYTYETGPIFAKATQDPFWNDNGLSEFIALGDGELLTVERSFALGVGNQINIFRASLAGTTDVRGAASIAGANVTPLAKEQVLKLDEGDFGLDIDNIEAISWGPEVGGRRTLVIASDNNFNPKQFTQFVVFQLDDATN